MSFATSISSVIFRRYDQWMKLYGCSRLQTLYSPQPGKPLFMLHEGHKWVICVLYVIYFYRVDIWNEKRILNRFSCFGPRQILYHMSICLFFSCSLLPWLARSLSIAPPPKKEVLWFVYLRPLRSTFLHLLSAITLPGGSKVFPDCFSGKEEWVMMLWRICSQSTSLSHFLLFLSTA